MPKKLTKTQRLLNEMKRRNGMTHTQIVKFILKMSGREWQYDPVVHRDYWNAQLYGTRDRLGILEQFCRKTKDGRWRVVRKVTTPFYKAAPKPWYLQTYISADELDATND